MTVHR